MERKQKNWIGKEKNMQTKSVQRIVTLINGVVIVGECEAVPSPENVKEPTGEILIKKPFQATPAGLMPYMIDLLAKAPPAIQIHPMNILHVNHLEDFPDVHKTYNDAISVLIKPETNIIV